MRYCFSRRNTCEKDDKRPAQGFLCSAERVHARGTYLCGGAAHGACRVERVHSRLAAVDVHGQRQQLLYQRRTGACVVREDRYIRYDLFRENGLPQRGPEHEQLDVRRYRNFGKVIFRFIPGAGKDDKQFEDLPFGRLARGAFQLVDSRRYGQQPQAYECKRQLIRFGRRLALRGSIQGRKRQRDDNGLQHHRDHGDHHRLGSERRRGCLRSVAAEYFQLHRHGAHHNRDRRQCGRHRGYFGQGAHRVQLYSQRQYQRYRPRGRHRRQDRSFRQQHQRLYLLRLRLRLRGKRGRYHGQPQQHGHDVHRQLHEQRYGQRKI